MMLRYEVAVSGRPQTFPIYGDGDPVHVAASRLGVGPSALHIVEFWAEADDGDDFRGPFARRTFQVFGTGHPLPDGAVWRGTCDRTPEGLVWHLYELEVL